VARHTTAKSSRDDALAIRRKQVVGAAVWIGEVRRSMTNRAENVFPGSGNLCLGLVAVDCAQVDVRSRVGSDVESIARENADVIPRHPTRLSRQVLVPPRYCARTEELCRDKEGCRQTELSENRSRDFEVVEVAVVKGDGQHVCYGRPTLEPRDELAERDNVVVPSEKRAKPLEITRAPGQTIFRDIVAHAMKCDDDAAPAEHAVKAAARQSGAKPRGGPLGQRHR